MLERVYGDVPDADVRASYERVLEAAAELLTVPVETRSDIQNNTHRMQARAFVALVTYIRNRTATTSPR